MAHISLCNSKLGSIPSVNLPPIITCRPDAPCAKSNLCYACKGRFRLQSVKNTLSRNLDEWKSSPDQYAQSIIDACTNVRFFRWHSAGDIPDVSYLDMMCSIARLQKEVHFLCFTKKYEMVNAYIAQNGKPDNLNIVFSAWGNLIPGNPHQLPIAYIDLKSEEGKSSIPESALPCSGSCNHCIQHELNCWNLKSGMSVVFHQH